MVPTGSRALIAGVFLAVVLFFAANGLAQTTATLVGSVKDAQGAIIPGATISLISETRGTSLETQTTVTGDFVFPNITGDTYTVRVTMDGFKTTERRDIAVSPGDRVAIGAIAVDVGTLSETVTVAGEAPLIQAASGERSFTVPKESVENLPVAGRNYASFAALTPGTVGLVRMGGGNPNYALDGVPVVDTGYTPNGTGGQGLQLNPDAIEEVKVLTSAFQAEYGRTNGLQIIGVTKSGSNQFRGSFYDIERNSDWNANSWANSRNGIAKPVSRERDWGATIGGPIGKPGGNNSWFFFFATQFSPRKTGGAVTFFRVPSVLERQGDFSQTTDQNGALFNLIRDASTGLPCTATDARGCFQDGGAIGRIPQNRLYGLGLNILKTYPQPNISGLNYNYQSVAPDDERTTTQPTVRVDYQALSKLRLTAKYTGQLATVKTTPGSIAGFNDTILTRPARIVPSATAVYTLSPTTVLEGTWGMAEFRQNGSIPNSPNTNRCNVGLCDFPLIYPDAGVAPPDSYQEEILAASGTPFYDNGRILLAPAYQWGSRIANPPPNNTYPAFLTMSRTNDIAISLTRLMGRHTAKAGFQYERSLKTQNLGTAGAVPFEGLVNFGNDSNNSLDTGFGYANAALGTFSSYQQQNHLFEGHYIYNTWEFYLQDNWKMTDRLTLDYGLRITNMGQQYDTKEQPSNFFSDQWTLADAPLLYQPGCAVVTSPCPGASRVAINPATGASLGAGSAVKIATLVPNTGNPLDGVIQAGKGIAKENYIWPHIKLGPRFGAAYDVSGNTSFVIRGGGGLFFDRPTGRAVFSQIGNPPTGQSSTVQSSQLQLIGSAGLQAQAPPTMTIYYYDSEYPSTWQWNGGVQMSLPFSSSLDISYVGIHGYNLIALAPTGTTIAADTVDLNAPDLGAAYLAKNQDPTLASSAIPGATALPNDMLRPYRGLGPIYTTWSRFWTQYDSIQTSYNRRFRNGWQAGLNYTLSLRTIGNTLSPLHLEHAADGTLSVRSNQAEQDDLLSNVGNRTHIFKGNFVWDLPDLHGESAGMRGLGVVVNDWQFSGVFTGGTGAAYDASYVYQTNGSNLNLTGSPNYSARIRVNGDPGSGCGSDPYKQFNTAAYAGPTYNSVGTESALNLMNGCADHTMDLSIARSIRLGGTRQAQFRFDLFNAFNTVVLSNRQGQLQLTNPADQGIRNAQFNPDGSINSARLTPQTAGFGAATAAQALRTVQVQLRFLF